MRISFSSAPHSPVELEPGANLSEHLTIENSPVLFGCRTGICGTCLIEVEAADAAQLAPPSDDERELLDIIAPGNPKARLACQLESRTDLEIKYLGNA